MPNWGVVNTGRPLQVKYWGVATPAALTPTPPSQLTERRYPSDRWAQQLRRKHLFQRCRRVAHSRAVRVALSHSVMPIGAARYGALGHVPPRLPTIYLVLLRFGAMVISRVKYLQDSRAAVIKITSINILLKKKWKLHIDFCITVYIEALFCVIMCVARVISMSFCAPPRAKSWRRHGNAQFTPPARTRNKTVLSGRTVWIEHNGVRYVSTDGVAGNRIERTASDRPDSEQRGKNERRHWRPGACAHRLATI